MQNASPQAVATLAAFIRDRLADISGALVSRRDSRLTLVLVGAVAPFATTSYARARLLRQMHGSGLLSAEQVAGVERMFAADRGAPR
jgi:hypothetical protein